MRTFYEWADVDGELKLVAAQLRDAAEAARAGDRQARRWVDDVAPSYLAVLLPAGVALEDLVARYREIALQNSESDEHLRNEQLSLLDMLKGLPDDESDEDREHRDYLQRVWGRASRRPPRHRQRDLALETVPQLQLALDVAG